MARKYTEATVWAALWAQYKTTQVYKDALDAFGTEDAVRKVWDEDTRYIKAVQYKGRWNDALALRAATIAAVDGVKDTKLLGNMVACVSTALAAVDCIKKMEGFVGSAQWHIKKAERDGNEEAAARWNVAATKLVQYRDDMFAHISKHGITKAATYYEAQAVWEEAKQG